MSDLSPHIRFLYSRQQFGIKLGLANIRRLLRFVSHPEQHYPTIHIAGTNGKGSTAAMIASVLTASGFRTGLYTSPHLIRFSERIRIDGEEIGEKDLSRLAQLLQPSIIANNATFFEATTAIAFTYFAEKKVDVAVIETGLGGRFDATNVLRPVLTVITSVGLDHTEYLGSTIEEIAFEKAGIMKAFVPCCVGTMEAEALSVIRSVGRQRHAPLLYERENEVRILRHSLDGIDVRLRTLNRKQTVLCSLGGTFQARNISLAIAALRHLARENRFQRIRESSILDGFAHIQEYAGLHGRFEVVSVSPLLVFDVAHNPDGTRNLVRSLRQLAGGKWIVLFGAMKDKDYCAMIDALAPIARLAVCVGASTPRSADPLLLMEAFHRRGVKAIRVAGGVSQGLRQALSARRGSDPVVVTGSHHVVGEGMEIFDSVKQT